MPSTVLYQAQMPVTYKNTRTDLEFDRKPEKDVKYADVDPNEIGWLPYIVSGPLTYGGWWGIPGAFVHVLSWLLVLIIDIWLFGWGEIDPKIAHGKMYAVTQLNLISMVLTIFSFVGLLFVIGYNFFVPYLPGTIPPWLVTVIKGGIEFGKYIAFAQVLLLGMGDQTMWTTVEKFGTSNETVGLWLNGTTTVSELDAEGLDFYHNLLNLTALALLFKVYIVECISSNVAYAGAPKKTYA